MIAGAASACCHLRYPYFCATPLSLFFLFFLSRIWSFFLILPFLFCLGHLPSDSRVLLFEGFLAYGHAVCIISFLRHPKKVGSAMCFFYL